MIIEAESFNEEKCFLTMMSQKIKIKKIKLLINLQINSIILDSKIVSQLILRNIKRKKKKFKIKHLLS